MVYGSHLQKCRKWMSTKRISRLVYFPTKKSISRQENSHWSKYISFHEVRRAMLSNILGLIVGWKLLNKTMLALRYKLLLTQHLSSTTPEVIPCLIMTQGPRVKSSPLICSHVPHFFQRDCWLQNFSLYRWFWVISAWWKSESRLLGSPLEASLAKTGVLQLSS